MAIRKIEKVYCSLGLGYIYNVNYSYNPKSGVKISLHFLNESGVYPTGFLSSSKKAQIRIGSAVFNMYPISKDESGSATEKTIRVDFVDEFFKLDNYFIALKGRGCGQNVFALGKVVDTRTEGEKEKEDPDLFKIKEFTSFQDTEYSFGEFLDVLRKIFSVKVSVSIPDSVTRPFTGTFADVLNAWCSYFNYSYFFENGTINIFDPTSLNITFPSIPSDAIEYSSSESIEDTYDKTAWTSFSQDGGEINIGTSETDGLFYANQTLYPWENVFDIKELNDRIYGNIDLDQVAAAQYGREFWFLYNYKRGTERDVCGFTRYQASPLLFTLPEVSQRSDETKASLGEAKDIAFFDEKVFEQNYEFYFNYGRSVAGRYYISKSKTGLGAFNLYQWFDQNGFSSVTLESLKSRSRVSAEEFNQPVDSEYGFIGEEFSIFKGIALNGSRVLFRDNIDREFEDVFQLNETQKQEIASSFKKLVSGDFGSGSMIWGDGTSRAYIIYEIARIPDSVTELINNLDDKKQIFNYRYNNFQMKGYFSNNIDRSNVNTPFDDTDIEIIDVGPRVTSNSSVIKAKKDSSYVAYYSKYENCDSVSSSSGGFGRRFEQITPSIDVAIPIEITRGADGVININRNLDYVNKYKESNILSLISKPFTIPQKRLSFSLNYFYQGIPSSFISNGLVGLSMNISDKGMSASYSYSNEMLRVPVSDQIIDKMERVIKSSWIRTYTPPKEAKL